ncbi:Solute carrier family 46 member 3 [Trichinella nelsoni]|uniref:Solute carrier family 46 member 3 n=1 Tax=Trichinella nelsoni TaxID=6336 RepID=A0A0V0RVY6_9BILA|nr:Solute carrier family 46 member 3 [Trichinella nelsoni]
MKLCRTRCTVTGPELFLFLTGISIGLYISAYSPFILFKVCLNYVSSNSLSNVDCMSITNSTVQSKIEAEASVYLVFLQLANTIPGIFSVLLVSAWSDAHGRKLPLLCCSAGCIVSSALMIAFAVYPSLSIHYLLFPQIIFGFFDPLFLFSFCFAMITDVVNVPSQVAVRMGIATGLLFLGILIGNLSCSLIETQLQYSYGYVFLASTVVSAVSFFCAVLFLRETRFLRDEQQQQQQQREQQQHPIGQKTLKELIITDGIMEYVSTLVKVRSESKRKLLWISLTIFLGLYMCDNGIGSLQLLYVKLSPLTFTDSEYSLMLSVQRSFAVVSTIGLPYMFKRIGWHDTSLILVGIALSIFKTTLFATSTNQYMVFFCKRSFFPQASAFGGLSTVYFPAFRSFLSSLVERYETVRLFSTIAMLEQLSPVLSTIVFNFLYAKLVTVYSGFVFMFSSAVKLIFFVIMGWIYWKTRIKSVQHTATVEVDKSDLIDEENNNSDTT